MTDVLSPQEALVLPLGDGNTTDATTVGQYLVRLAGFQFFEPTAAAPFKNFGWRVPLIFAFANANLIWLRTDENGQIDDFSEDKFNDIVQELLDFLFKADFSTIEPTPEPPEPKEWYVVCVEKDGAAMTDYFGCPYTEADAKSKAEAENKGYSYHRWNAVHIPT